MNTLVNPGIVSVERIDETDITDDLAGLCRLLLSARRALQEAWRARPSGADPAAGLAWRTGPLEAAGDAFHAAWCDVRQWARDEVFCRALWTDGAVTSESFFAGARSIGPRRLEWAWGGTRFAFELRHPEGTLELREDATDA